MATPTGSSVSLSGTATIDGLHQGSSWTGLGSDRTLTYSLWNSSFGSWDAETASIVDFAFGLWEAAIDVTFQRVAPNGTGANNSSDISMTFVDPAFFAGDPNAPSMSFYPDPASTDAFFTSVGADPSDFPTADGDILINGNFPDALFTDPGTAGFQRLLQEIGSVLGLKDPGVTEGSFQSYASLGIGQFDSTAWTVMSDNAGNTSIGRPATPMQLDIEAAQAIYGANTDHNSGDSVYPLSSAGYVTTIWDMGGNDFLSAMNLTGNWMLSLAPGTASWSTGNPQSDANRTFIAEGVTIENAIGSQQNDILDGTDLENGLWGLAGGDSLVGAGGDDTLMGNPGNDTIDGGAGNDSIKGHPGDDVIDAGAGNDTVFAGANQDVIVGGDGDDTLNGNAGHDTVNGGGGDDLIRGQGGADLLRGDAGNDLILGMFGFDTLEGGDGNDTLLGGEAWDTLTGGGGADVFMFGDDHGKNLITDFVSGVDRIMISAGSFDSMTIGASSDGAVITWIGTDTSVTVAGFAPDEFAENDILLL